VVTDLTDLSSIESELVDLDACLFCLGISSVGLDEAAYTRITYDTAMAAGRTLAKLNPQLTMCFVSGAGTDASGAGRSALFPSGQETLTLGNPWRAHDD
jgi:hypothetical protein